MNMMGALASLQCFEEQFRKKQNMAALHNLLVVQ